MADDIPSAQKALGGSDLPSARSLAQVEAARHLLRSTFAGDRLGEVFDRIAGPLLDGFSATALWIEAFDSADTERMVSRTGLDADDITPALRILGRRAADILWREQRMAYLSPTSGPDPLLTPEEHALGLEFLGHVGAGSVVLFPIGSGEEMFGAVVLLRPTGEDPWTETDEREMLSLGHDLGLVVETTRVLAREMTKADDIRTLQRYQRDVLRTIAHDLRNPAMAVAGHLDLQLSTRLDETSHDLLTALRPQVTRLSHTIDDLVLLARSRSPRRDQDPAPLDLVDCFDVARASLERRTIAAGPGLPKLESSEAPIPMTARSETVSDLLTCLLRWVAESPEPARATLAAVAQADDLTITVQRCPRPLDGGDQDLLTQLIDTLCSELDGSAVWVDTDDLYRVAITLPRAPRGDQGARAVGGVPTQELSAIPTQGAVHSDGPATAEERRLAVAGAALDVVRAASRGTTLQELLDACREPLLIGFGAQAVFSRIYGEVDGESEAGTPAIGDDDARQAIRDQCERLWAQQAVAVVSTVDFADDARIALHGRDTTPLELPSDQLPGMVALLTNLGIGAVLVAPFGQGDRCLGHVILARSDGSPWNEADAATALEIGHDLGRLIDQVRLYEKERAFVAELEKIGVHKDELVARGADLLRPAVASIRETVDAFDPDSTTESVERSLEVLRRCHGRMSVLVEDLAALSELRDPGAPVAAEPVDLQALVEDAIVVLEHRMALRGIAVEVRVEGSRCAWGSPAELDHVVMNLLDNALKYNDDGGSITVEISEGLESGTISMTVADTGVGIAATDRGAVFDDFFRGGKESIGTQSGTGLGLAIVKRIVGRHRGSIAFTSVVGEGSEFLVVLPAVPEVVEQ